MGIMSRLAYRVITSIGYNTKVMSEGVLSITSFKFNEVPFDVIVYNNDDENKSYFFGSKVASALGYKDPDSAVRRHCRKTVNFCQFDVTPVKHRGLELHPNTVMIPESDVYRLIIRSKIKEAVEFQDFICDTVLPSLRKYGTYPPPPTISPKPSRQIGYDVGTHNDRVKHFESLKCECMYNGGFQTISSQCECVFKDERQQARKETLVEADILKSGPHCEAGKKGGSATQQKWRDLQEEIERLKSRVSELEKLN